MKRNLLALAAAAVTGSAASAESLYYIGSEAQESLPLKWTVGLNMTWDDNVTPTVPVGVPGHNDEVFSLNPYVGLSFVNMTPQSTLDVYARLGAVYYIDEPAAIGADEIYTQARAGINYTHRFSERLRFSTRNFVAYELEPDYSRGFASTRQVGEYLYFSTDNSIGYRWTERFATYTGFSITGLEYDDVLLSNSDRLTWQVYNQFRYQLTPQSLLTADIRYRSTEADGLASDSEDLFLLLGIEHRFSPNTILVARGGAQFRETDAVASSDTTSPYLELALRSQMNDQFSLRAYTRYGMEVYDTTRFVPIAGLVDFDDRRTLRIGLSGEYAISPMFSLFGGVDWISAKFEEGRAVPLGGPVLVAPQEDLINAYIGMSVRFTDYLYGSLSYNYTDSDSDFTGYSYDRNRVNVGIRAEF